MCCSLYLLLWIMSQDSIPIKYQLSKRHGVLIIFLLPWKNTITKATNKRKHLICDLQFQRVGVHDHYVKEHGTGEIAESLHPIHKYQAES